jgi:hypothetical protein
MIFSSDTFGLALGADPASYLVDTRVKSVVLEADCHLCIVPGLRMHTTYHLFTSCIFITCFIGTWTGLTFVLPSPSYVGHVKD